MSKPSTPRFRMPAVWIAAVAVIAIAVAGLAVKFPSLPAKDARALNPTSNKHLAPTVNTEQRGRVRASLDALPLAFEANQGQTDPQVKYTARGNGYSVFLTANDTVFAISSARHSTAGPSRTGAMRPRTQTAQKVQNASIDMRLVGGNSKPEIAADNELPGIVNYYVGSDPKNWHTGVKQYSTVSYRGVYPGVNMVFHGAQRQLEFDFVVSPGADPKEIALGFKGARKLNTDAAGNLVLNSSAGDVVLHKPVAYQEKDGKRESVEAAFQVRGRNEVTLNLGAYDRGRELVVDPTLTYATYLGGNAEDDALGIAIDSSGNAYVTGQTKSANFPMATGYSAGFDVFVSKIAADGSSLIYSTYIGGSGDDSGTAIAVDASFNAFVVGGTMSTDFPKTTGAFQTTNHGQLDAFVLELASSAGSLTFSTYLGGSLADVANGVAIDSTGVYVVGSTASTDFPVQTSGAFQGSINGTSNGFVTKLNTSGTSLAYSTYLGGGSTDVATAVAVNGGQAYVTGITTHPTFPISPSAFQKTCGTDGTCNGGLDDAFVTVFDAGGSNLVYSTFLGGESNDLGLGIAVDSAGDAYVTGLTQSSQFPLKSALQPAFGGGLQDAFVSELNPAGTALVYSTYLGGSGDDAGAAIAVDASKNAYITGNTTSMNFPTAGATQAANGGGTDAFIGEISTSGSSLLFSTYLGGSQNENLGSSGGNLSVLGTIAVDSAGANIYVAGNTSSSPFPTVNALQTTYGGGTDAFVAKYATGAVSGGSFTVTNGALSTTSGHAGISATATITVGSTNGFNSAVQLHCTVTPAVTKGPTCSFSNPSSGSVTPAPNGTATATLNVATTTASAMLVHSGDRLHAGILYALILPVFGMTFIGVGAQRRRRKTLVLAMLGLALVSLLLMPACGGSSSGSGGGGGSGTPTGTYTINVNGTSGSTVVTGTPALTLTIN